MWCGLLRRCWHPRVHANSQLKVDGVVVCRGVFVPGLGRQFLICLRDMFHSTAAAEHAQRASSRAAPLSTTNKCKLEALGVGYFIQADIWTTPHPPRNPPCVHARTLFCGAAKRTTIPRTTIANAQAQTPARPAEYTWHCQQRALAFLTVGPTWMKQKPTAP